MDATDPSLVGVHCQHAYCNQLDFLPFTCESCHATFCLEHRTERAHACAHAGAWAQRQRQAALARPPQVGGALKAEVEQACAAATCKVVIGTSLSTSVHCAVCTRNYCLKHRMPEDHACTTRVPSEARVRGFDQHADHVKGALARLKAWGAGRKAALAPSARTSAAARITALNTLKKTAKGDDKVPLEKRIYLHVEAEAATTKSKFPSGAFFYSRDWVIGRLLDAAAKHLQVQNVNNQGDEEKNKLRVFHVEGGRLLEFNEKVGEALLSGNKIVLLRGIGPAVPDLVDLT
ncbi:hypothetical protein K3495_g1042 [Podosphaera aphanis]|nr:hypothetical protein K3495_g1042 [Podosphaera aphanis]